MLPTDGYPQTNSLRIVPPDVDCGFKIFDKPHPRIAKALLGPFLVENSKVRVDLPMRCLAVNTEGTYAGFLTVDPHQLWNPATMWKHIAWVLHVRYGHRTAEPRLNDKAGHTVPMTDCLKTWTAPFFWDCPELDRWPIDEYRVPYGKKASDKSYWQSIIRDCVSETLLALDPRLRRLLYARPLIGMGIVRILLDLAAQRGSAAIDHAWAALMREPLPLLYLMASGKPAGASRRVRNAVFKGGDLPGLLRRMGIPEQTYKRTRRSDQCSHDEELDVEWGTWFNLLKTTRRNPPSSDDDWQEFRTLLRPDRGLHSATSVIALCIEKGYKQCNQHWNLIHEAGIQLKNALEVATGEIGIPGYVIDFDSNVAAHCKIVQSLQKGNDLLKIHPPENTNWVKDVTDTWIFNIEMMEQHLFDATPEIPDQLHIPELFSLKKLFRSTITEDKDFFDWIESYSDAVGNYLLTNFAIYEVRKKSEITGNNFLVGLIALGYNRSKNRIELFTVYGNGSNQNMTIISNLATEMIQAYNIRRNKKEWHHFSDKVRLLEKASKPLYFNLDPPFIRATRSLPGLGGVDQWTPTGTAHP